MSPFEIVTDEIVTEMERRRREGMRPVFADANAKEEADAYLGLGPDADSPLLHGERESALLAERSGGCSYGYLVAAGLRAGILMTTASAPAASAGGYRHKECQHHQSQQPAPATASRRSDQEDTRQGQPSAEHDGEVVAPLVSLKHGDVRRRRGYRDTGIHDRVGPTPCSRSGNASGLHGQARAGEADSSGEARGGDDAHCASTRQSGARDRDVGRTGDSGETGLDRKRNRRRAVASAKAGVARISR